MRFLRVIPIVLFIALLANPVSADSLGGRYQGFVLPKGNNDLGGEHMMVLDTVTGDLWQWWIHRRSTNPLHEPA